MPLPRWIEPQLSKLAAKAPTGPQWVHKIKFDGYRMAARIEKGQVKLLTRSGLDWTAKYPAMAAAIAQLEVNTAYIDGELCGVRPDGVTSFEIMQQVSDSGGGHLTYFAFDLLEHNGEDVPCRGRSLFVAEPAPLGEVIARVRGRTFSGLGPVPLDYQ